MMDSNVCFSTCSSICFIVSLLRFSGLPDSGDLGGTSVMIGEDAPATAWCLLCIISIYIYKYVFIYIYIYMDTHEKH